MNFSDLFKQTGQLCHFSPDGNYLANAVQYRLIIRDTKTLQISHLFTCLDAIQFIEWSPDSQFILCGMNKRCLVQVWSLEQPEWTCKIDEGPAGLGEVHFGPDSRHVLTTADFHSVVLQYGGLSSGYGIPLTILVIELRVTVWSLLNKSVSYIKYPKDCQKGFDYCLDGKYLALAERRDCKDYISIFACNTWQLLKHFETETEDLAGVCWSPNAHSLAVWESCLEYKVLLYSLDGRVVAQYKAYEPHSALGIKSLTWSPTSQFLAIGSYDEKVRLLNHLTYKLIIEHSHPATVNGSKVVVYKETVKNSQYQPDITQKASSVMFAAQSKYEVVDGTVQIPVVRPEKKANPKLGVGTVAFSSDSKYMYTINDNMPSAVWLWDMRTLRQAVLILQDTAVKHFLDSQAVTRYYSSTHDIAWDPSSCRLALCTGTNRIYMWSPAGCLSVEIPNEATFTVQSLHWHPSGRSLLLLGRQRMCVCFLVDTASETGEIKSEIDSEL